MDSLVVRPARVEDVSAMARVHVGSWRETYRGLMPDEALDDPGLFSARERFWEAALTDDRYAANRVAVAENDSAVVGIAMSGPPENADASWSAQLYVLYVVATHHGSGAGSALLDAVIAPHQAAALWVADPSPRAQAFYRKHGFVPDGKSKVEDGVRVMRMVRTRDESHQHHDRVERPARAVRARGNGSGSTSPWSTAAWMPVLAEGDPPQQPQRAARSSWPVPTADEFRLTSACPLHGADVTVVDPAGPEWAHSVHRRTKNRTSSSSSRRSMRGDVLHSPSGGPGLRHVASAPVVIRQ